MSSYLYIISAVAGGKPCAPVKIGISNSPRSRFNTIKTSSPLRLRLFYVLTVPSKDDAIRIEQRMHYVLKQQRSNGEWFDMEPEHAQAALGLIVDMYMTITLGLSQDVANQYLKQQGML